MLVVTLAVLQFTWPAQYKSHNNVMVCAFRWGLMRFCVCVCVAFQLAVGKALSIVSGAESFHSADSHPRLQDSWLVSWFSLRFVLRFFTMSHPIRRAGVNHSELLPEGSPSLGLVKHRRPRGDGLKVLWISKTRF